jgi:hypothetical protein
VPAPPGTAPSSTECSSRADSLSEGAQEAVQRALRRPVQRALRRPLLIAQWSVVSGQWSVLRAPCPPSGGLMMRRLYHASPRKSAQGRRASMAERTYGRRSGWTTDHRLPEETILYMAGAHGGARHGVE